MENVELGNRKFWNKSPFFSPGQRNLGEKGGNNVGIFWGLNSLRDPNLGCGAGVSHDPDPGLSMIRNRDLPRSGAGSAWTMWGWSFPLVEFPVCPIFPSGLDGGNTLGCPEWDWPCPPFPGILCSYSCDFSWKTTLVANLLPFFSFGNKTSG